MQKSPDLTLRSADLEKLFYRLIFLIIGYKNILKSRHSEWGALSQMPFSLGLLPRVNDINDPKGLHPHHLVILDSQS